MKRVLVLLVTVLVLFSSLVWAHGPTRKKVVASREIAAPPGQVWTLIGNFQDMAWLPVVARTEGEGGNAPGATRTLILQDGAEVHEKLEKYDADKHSLFYRIEDVDVKVLPVTNYSSWLSVEPTDAGSKVTWKGAFYRGYPNNDPPPELSDQAAIDAVTALYNLGLDNLVQLVAAGGQRP